MSGVDSWVVRSLQRSDLASYAETLHYGIGPLERSTGLDENAEATFRSLERWPVWAIFRLMQAIGRPFASILVAADHRTVAGTGTILWLPRSAYVAGMATRPDYRRRGIASRILRDMQGLASRHRREWLALDVESDNETAIRVYRTAGYRPVARYVWLTREGLPPSSEVPSTGLRPASSRDLRELAAQVGSVVPPEYRAAFPTGPRLLTHNEILVRTPGVRGATWVTPTPKGQLAALRLYYVPRPGLGAFFPIAPPSMERKELAGLVDAAAGWLRSRAPKRCFAVVSEDERGVREHLAEFGFAPAVSSTLMIRRTTADGQGAEGASTTSASTNPS